MSDNKALYKGDPRQLVEKPTSLTSYFVSDVFLILTPVVTFNSSLLVNFLPPLWLTCSPERVAAATHLNYIPGLIRVNKLIYLSGLVLSVDEGDYI